MPALPQISLVVLAERLGGPDECSNSLGLLLSGRLVVLSGYLQMADNDAASSTVAPDAGDDVAADSKIDVVRDGTPSSMESTPEHDGAVEATQEPTQPQKRKGGRKPVSLEREAWFADHYR